MAVVDEIQMLRDPQRSWAWTRALLGVNADEVHLCGEVSAVGFVRDLVESIGDSFELKAYKRLTPLKISKSAVGKSASLTEFPVSVRCVSLSLKTRVPGPSRFHLQWLNTQQGSEWHF